MKPNPGWLTLPAALFGSALLVVGISLLFVSRGFQVFLYIALGLWGAGSMVFFLRLVRYRMYVLACLGALGVGLIIYSQSLASERVGARDPDPSAPALYGGIALCLFVLTYVLVASPFTAKLALLRGAPVNLILPAGIIALGSSAFLTGFQWGLFHFMSEASRQEEAVANYALSGGLLVAAAGWLALAFMVVAAKRPRPT